MKAAEVHVGSGAEHDQRLQHARSMSCEPIWRTALQSEKNGGDAGKQEDLENAFDQLAHINLFFAAGK